MIAKLVRAINNISSNIFTGVFLVPENHNPKSVESVTGYMNISSKLNDDKIILSGNNQDSAPFEIDVNAVIAVSEQEESIDITLEDSSVICLLLLD